MDFVKCPSCGAMNDHTSAHCSNCGHSLLKNEAPLTTWYCSRCHSVNDITSLHCRKCNLRNSQFEEPIKSTVDKKHPGIWFGITVAILLLSVIFHIAITVGWFNGSALSVFYGMEEYKVELCMESEDLSIPPGIFGFFSLIITIYSVYALYQFSTMKPNGLTHIAAISLTSVTPITFRALAMFGFCYSNYLKDYMYNFFYKPYSWTTTIIFFIVATIFSRVCMWLCKNKQEYFQ